MPTIYQREQMMWTIIKVIYRIVHFFLKLALYVIRFPKQELLAGAGIVKQLPKKVKETGLSNLLVVTDKPLMDIGLPNPLLEALAQQNITYTVFDDVEPNPKIKTIEKGVKVYRENKCQGVIAFGGGSPIDCAKIIAARATNKKQSIHKMRGLFKIRWKAALLFAVPTTAGTGSETTIAAVVTDSENHEKFAISSFKIVPKIAVLDPELMLGLPPHITSITGMDALTHAVESYVSLMGTSFTDDMAEKAVKIIFEDLEVLYKDGSNIEKRNNMALASYYAGAAFTRTYVGYVHAIAHNMGGMYGVPHGLANAIILPYVMEQSRKNAEDRLAKLAIVSGLGKNGESNEKLSLRLIEKIKNMNQNMDIPLTIKELQEKDIPLIAERAYAESNPWYPVPTLLNKKELEQLVQKLLPS